MIVECNEYLKEKLKAAGIQKPIIINQKKLKDNNEKRFGAVLPDKEEIATSGKMKTYTDEQGNKKKRTQKFSRVIYFIVIIGEYSLDKCAEVYENFLSSIDYGLYIDGNWAEMTIEEIDWVDKEDSILKSEITVQMLVKFEGGVYKDTDFKAIQLENTEVEIEHG